MLNPSAFENAIAHPNTNPSMFQGNSWVDMDSGVITARDEDILLKTSPFAKKIGDSLIELPTYDIELVNSDGKSLSDRVAIIAIGSNCSPEVLYKKFKDKVGGDFLIAQSEIQNHAVVHGAFFGNAGTIPATVMPHQGTTTNITIGFYTPEQAKILTGTEWNYDVVQAGFTPFIKQGSGIAIEQGAAMYVSPWGAFTVDGENPVALKDIPSQTDLEKANSLEMMTRFAKILKQHDIEAFYNSLPGTSDEDYAHRLKHVFEIQAHNALPARIAGKPIWKATIGAQCEKIGRQLPGIEYL